MDGEKIFHGKISRGEAEELLLQHPKQGRYLVRASSSNPGHYVLSLLCGGQPLHFQIQHQGECWFSIDDGPLFEGIDAVLAHYSSHSDGLPCNLSDVCVRTPRRNSKHDSSGSTSLHSACANGKTSSVKSKLSAGDINRRNGRGRTPLMEAVKSKSVDVVKLVLGYKPKGSPLVDVNIADDLNCTALHFAAKIGDPAIIKELLTTQTVNPHVRSADGETAREIASRLASIEACKLLGHGESGYTSESDLASRDHPWNHGKLNRKAAENILSKHGFGEGLFLVRDSSSVAGDFVLTMSAAGQAYHFQIQSYKKECYFIDDGPVFEGLAKVIEYYRTTADGLPTMLRQYSPRSRKGKRTAPTNLTPTGQVAQPIAPPGAHSNPHSNDKLDYDKMSSRPGRKESQQPDSPLMITFDELEMTGEELGAGEFGAVLKGYWNRAGCPKVAVAIKTLRSESIGRGEREFLREANVMLKLAHPHVVQLFGICPHQPMMIVQELVTMGSLLDFLPKNRDGLKNENLLHFAQQIAAGMVYLESERFVHRDLATRNILVSSPTCVKISDFGLSRAIGADDNYYKASAGGKWPVKWYAPESVYYGKFTHKSDVWSFGVTLWEIWTYGDLPYGDATGHEVLQAIEKGTRLPRPHGCNEATYEICRQCWEYNPDDRPDFSSINDRFFKMLPSKLQKISKKILLQ